MVKVWLFLILAILGNEALGMSFRHKRQADADAVTPSPLVVESCIRTCPVTAEYNPVCGTDNKTYDNPSRLFCAQACGVTVSRRLQSRCPPAAN